MLAHLLGTDQAKLLGLDIEGSAIDEEVVSTKEHQALVGGHDGYKGEVQCVHKVARGRCIDTCVCCMKTRTPMYRPDPAGPP